MNNLFFFTVPNSIVTQLNDSSTGEAFGPISNTKYQISSNHKAASGITPKAISVTSGTIAAVQSSVSIGGSTVQYINLILKPDKRMTEITGLDIPDIKYIIYKGIQINSIIDASVPGKIAPNTSNELTKKIWHNQDLYNAAYGSSAFASVKILRLDPDTPFLDTENIDVLFNPSTDENYELTRIDQGIYLGDFLTTESFGIEFVRNEIRSKITFKEARQLNTLIDTSTITHLAKVKQTRETILHYLDPAAFYGSLAIASAGDLNLNIWNPSPTNPVIGGTPVKVLPNEIYEKLLPKLYNKNRVYIDIRNEYNQSFNYQNAYSNTLQLRKGKGADYVDTMVYDSWPLIVIDNLPGGYTPDVDTSNFIELSIKLPLSAMNKDNERPLVLSYLDYTTKDDKLVRLKDYEQLIELKKGLLANDYFNGLTFYIKNYEPPSGPDNIQPISTLIRLKVFRLKSRFQSDDQTTRQENHIDALLLPFGQRRTTTGQMEIRTFQEDVYMGTQFHIDDLPFNEQNYPITDFVSSVGFAFEDAYVTFFTYANRRKNPISNKTIEFTATEFDESQEFLNAISDKYREGFTPIIGTVELDIPGLPGQLLYRYKSLLETPKRKNNILLSEEFSAVSITKDSYDLLSDGIDPTHPSFSGIDSNYDIHLVLRNREKHTAPLITTPADIHGYNTYDLVLRGFQEDPTGNGLLPIEWNSGVTLISYSEQNAFYNGEAKSMVLLEPGIALTDPEPDNYLPCNRHVFSAPQIADFLEYRKRLRDGAAHIANKDIREKVFRFPSSAVNPGDPIDVDKGYVFDLNETTGEVRFVDNFGVQLNYLPDFQLKGFIMEAAISFAVWNLCSLLTATDEDNYVFTRLINVLLDNGLKQESVDKNFPGAYPNAEDNLQAIRARLFSPFLHYGEAYSYPDPIIDTRGRWNYSHLEDQYVFTYPPVHSGNDLAIIKSNDTPGYVVNNLLPSSFKNELFNIIRSHNFAPILRDGNNVEYKASYPLTTEELFFDVPFSGIFDRNNPTAPFINRDISAKPGGEVLAKHIYADSLDSTVTSWMEAKIGAICHGITAEFKDLISTNAECFYKVFTKNLLSRDSFIPKFRLVATGDGSTTIGFTYPKPGTTFTFQGGIFSGPGKLQGLGSSLFTYDLDRNGTPKLKYEETLNTIDKDTVVAIHLSIYGADKDNAPDVVEIELSGPEVGGSGDKVVMRFVVDQSLGDLEKKLFPEPSLLPSTIPPYLVYADPTNPSAPFDERVSLQSSGTSLELISGSPTTPGIITSHILFKDRKGQTAGEYFGEYNNLIIKKKAGYSITLRVLSGRGTDGSTNPKLATYPGGNRGDEIQVSASVFEMTPPVTTVDLPEDIVISAERLYDNDKFEVRSTKKRELINDDTIESYKKLANLIHNQIIKTEDLKLLLKGWNIGVKDPASTSNPNHVKRDDRFAFGDGILPGDNKVRPATLGWVEIPPTPDIVNIGSSLEKLYHPNDPNGNKTRLLEVPDWLNEADMQQLRYSYARISVTPYSSSRCKLDASIESFVSPIWSRLDRVIGNDFRHEFGGEVHGMTKEERVALLDSYTLYNAGATGSDAFIKFISSPGVVDPKGSYNPILSCLRSFGIMEAIRDNIVYMATHESELDTSTLSPVEAQAIYDVIQAAIQTIVIEADPTIGYTMNITYDFYENLKWYSSPGDEMLYGPTAE